MILASGCIFTPRDAAQPDENSVEWIRPIEPGNVLANMRAALEAQQRTNYENSLSAAFVFHPLGRDAVDAPPGYYVDFGRTRELAAIDKLYLQAETLSLDWNYDANTDLTESGDSAYIQLDDYQLTVLYTTGDEVLYEGEVRLTLADEGGQWQLVIWDESESSAEQENSWGRLRAILDIP
jgi:hypothetical protein